MSARQIPMEPEMAQKKVDYTKTDVGRLPDDKPVVYRIQTEGGKDNYVGSAQRGRVQERISEHFDKIPGAKVQVQQFNSIQDARAHEQRVINRSKPKFNKKGK